MLPIIDRFTTKHHVTTEVHALFPGRLRVRYANVYLMYVKQTRVCKEYAGNRPQRKGEGGGKGRGDGGWGGGDRQDNENH